jgi:hypothetical protein
MDIDSLLADADDELDLSQYGPASALLTLTSTEHSTTREQPNGLGTDSADQILAVGGAASPQTLFLFELQDKSVPGQLTVQDLQGTHCFILETFKGVAVKIVDTRCRTCGAHSEIPFPLCEDCGMARHCSLTCRFSDRDHNRLCPNLRRVRVFFEDFERLLTFEGTEILTMENFTVRQVLGTGHGR